MEEKDKKKTEETLEEETAPVSEKEKESGRKKKEKEKLLTELAEARAETKKWQNEYYRVFADMENLRRSIEKDHHEALRYRAEGFINSLLPILDGFHAALKEENAMTAEMKSYLTGFSYLYKNLVSVLVSEGVEEIDPKVGGPFDPKTMDALETKETDGPENIVLKVHAKGYRLHDHLIRPALVLVSLKPVIKDTEETKKEAKKDESMKGEEAPHDDA